MTTGANGIYLRRDNNAVVVTWNNIRDFPNDPTRDRGIHRFQVTLFSDGRIRFTYDTAQLTTTAAAAPSQLALHIGRVLGYAIITSFMISSSVIRLV